MDPFGDHLSTLNQLVRASETRHEVISHNLANVNTPNYRRLDVRFEDMLAEAVKRGDSATGGLSPEVIQTLDPPVRADGNNVDLDKEIGTLNKNALLQQVYLGLLTSEMSMMQRAMESR